MYSSALRRLGAKTQVLGPSSDDFIRTRLTHSLEVSQVGRVLAKSLGCDPDVVDTACLAHDLGHPPFGHNGERALNELCVDIGGFEGNAQTMRILVRLEPKVTGPNRRPLGVNLTRASLDAVAKYPWARGEGPDPKKSSRKYSVYADDMEIFEWMRQRAPRHKRCLEAQLMDISDDIAYSVHDVEDAIQQRLANPAVLLSADERQKIFEASASWYGGNISADELDAAADRLITDGMWMDNYSESYSAFAQLKDVTSQIIGRFCTAVHNATRETYGNQPLHRYDCDLVVPRDTQAEIQLLKATAVAYVMAPREFEPLYLQQRTILYDVVSAFEETGEQHLEEPFLTAYRQANNDGERLRAIIDQVASMTDHSAQMKHASMVGMVSRFP